MSTVTGYPWFRDCHVVNHYDVPLAGYCRWYNEWCFWLLENAGEAWEDNVPRVYGVYRIRKRDAIRALWRAFLFNLWLVLRWEALRWLVYGPRRGMGVPGFEPKMLERIGEFRPDDKPFRFPSSGNP